MFDLIHQMRTRIITSPAFTGERIIGSILFEQTMDREIDGRGTADYLWNVKHVVPFLKVDKGLAEESDGVQLMKPMPGLDEHFRGIQQRLRRYAADVEAGTAQRVVLLHDRRLQAQLRGLDRTHIATGT